MKKQIILFAMLIGVFIGLVPEVSQASHNTGGDISYTYLSPNTYLIRYRFYRDASGIGAPLTVPVCYSSVQLGFSSTVTCNPIAGTGGPITQSPCVPPGSGYNIEEYIYEGVVVLPNMATDWRFHFTECCRNGAITTIVPNYLYIYVTLDNQNFPTNNSTQFAFQPVTEFCINNPFYFQHGAFDPDGDSLHFSLTAALDVSSFTCPYVGTSVTYNAGYSATNPFSSSVPIVCDPLSGTVYFIPNLLQTGVMAVLVEEFDPVTKAKKAETIRDIQVNIVSGCNIIPPNYDPGFDSSGVSVIVDGTVNLTCDDTTFYLVFDSTALLQCGSIVASDVRVTMPNGTPNPVVSVVGVGCFNGLTDSLLVTVLNPLPAGTSYAYTKIGNDGNTFLSICGSSMDELDSIPLVITDNTTLVVDSTSALVGCVFDRIDLTFNQPVNCFGIAANGSDFTVVDANGTNIPVTGALCGGAANPNAPHYSNQISIITNPGSTGVGPLYVISHVGTDGNTISNSCETYIAGNDTIAIVTVLTYIPVNLGNDITLCDRPPYPVLNMSVLSPGAIFSWTLNGTSIGTNNDSLLANQSGTYIGSVSVGAVCSGTDTIVVNLVPTPTVTITDGVNALGDSLYVCTGNPLPVLSATTTGNGYQWYYNGTLIPGATNSSYVTTVAGLYTVETSAAGAGCLTTDQILVLLNSPPVASLGSNQTVCSNAAQPVLTTPFLPGASYQWTANGVAIPGVTTNQYQPTTTAGGTTTYEVTVSNGGCTATATVDVTVISITAVALGNDLSYCAGVSANPIDGTTIGAVSYQWYNSSGIIAGANTSNYTPVTDVSTDYIIVVDFGNGCTSTDTVNVSYLTQVTVTSNDVTYCQGSTPSALNATGNVGNLTFTWSFNGNQVGTGASFVPTNGPGVYTVVGDFNGQCNGTTTATVTEIELPSNMTVTGAGNYCVGDVINDLQSDYPVNGQFGTTYAWTQNGVSFGGNTQTITPTNATGNYTYGVTITNTANGVNCTATASAQVNINPIPSLDALINDTYCLGDPIDALVALVNVPVGQTFIWSQNGTVLPGEVTNTYTPNSVVGTNVYTVETDLNGCKQTGSATIVINALPQPALSAIVKGESYSDNVPFCLSENPQPQITAGLTGTGYVYTWTLNGTALTNTTPTQPITTSGIYGIEVTDANGCRNTDLITTVEIPCTLVFYNIITPDGNGQNDVFFIENLENYAGKKLTVYNRWGKEVFSSDSYDNKWDGGDLSSGSYFYTLETNNGVEEKAYKGIVEIVK